MRVLVHREFEVDRPRSEVWSRLARPASWASWAKHIKSVDVEPPGLLTASSSGVVRLRNGVRSRFVVTTFADGERWLWAGKFLWLRVDYDHDAFEESIRAAHHPATEYLIGLHRRARTGVR